MKSSPESPLLPLPILPFLPQHSHSQTQTQKEVNAMSVGKTRKCTQHMGYDTSLKQETRERNRRSHVRNSGHERLWCVHELSFDGVCSCMLLTRVPSVSAILVVCGPKRQRATYALESGPSDRSFLPCCDAASKTA